MNNTSRDGGAGLAPAEPERGKAPEPSQGSRGEIRDGGAGLAPAEPERGKAPEPSQGSRGEIRDGGAGLAPAEPERGKAPEPSQGSRGEIRDGGAGLAPAEPERGKAPEPSQGSRGEIRDGGAGLAPAEPERGKAREPSQGSRGEMVVRFSPFERGQHLAVMVLFSVLALTGFPQKFHDAQWTHWLVQAMGGISQVRHLHRLAGGMFAGLAVLHLGAVIAAVLSTRTTLAMVPTRKDFQDSVTTLRYYLRLSEKHAQFDRFDYREKFEYWGIVMGGIIMISTGFVLLFPMQATQWLPGEVVPAAKLAHSNEGLMAFLVVLTWHIYNVHFAPEVFPFNRAMFTGKISREHMREHHGLEYARRFPNESKQQEPQTPGPTKEK